METHLHNANTCDFRYMILDWLHKIQRKWIKLRLQPIRVYCLHHVSDEYNPLTMWECDWTQTELFKRNILRLKSQYTFIPLAEAYEKMQQDVFRFRKYAVLTADDGYKSLLSVLPWLEEQQIPITLFINTKYLNGKSWSEINEEQAMRAKPDVDMLEDVCPDLYMSKEELFSLTSSLITVGMHGHEHLDGTEQSVDEFKQNIEQCRDILIDHPRYVPFFAYTWGRYNKETNGVLKEMGLVPVLVNGTKNYTYEGYIDRLAIDGKQL